MKIFIKKFEELSVTELYQILRLRSEVFVVEQECIFQDMDEKDNLGTHVFGMEKKQIIAYTRILGPGDYYEEPCIARVLVKKERRGDNKGKEIMDASIKYIRDNFKNNKIIISAQSYLEKFYRELGFIVEGNEYFEDGIPHIRMVLKL